MSISPPKPYNVFSPIRDLQDRSASPSRRGGLDVIIQESTSKKRSPSRYQYHMDKYASKSSAAVDRKVAPTSNYNTTEAKLNQLESSSRRNDNQNLVNQNFASNIYARELNRKDLELESLRRQLILVQDKLEKENSTLAIENEHLRNQLIRLEGQKADELDLLRLRYSAMPEHQRELIRQGYTKDIAKALLDLQAAYCQLQEKQKEVQHLSAMCKQNSYEYQVNLEDLISENNGLKGRLAQFQISTEKEIRELTSRKELEKSRTQGILSHCKENTLYIEKEIMRLADELLKKNINIESFSREVTKQQRLIEEQDRRNKADVQRLKKDYEEALENKDKKMQKMETTFKFELAESKRVEMELLEKVASLESQLETLVEKLRLAEQTVEDKRKEVSELKGWLERKDDDHAKEINKVMSNSRMGRKSLKNISSYSSFKDIDDGQGSSMIRSGKLNRRQSLAADDGSQERGEGDALPTVQEEHLAQSQGLALEEDDCDMRELVAHYESLIDELKRNKANELSVASNKIENLKLSLNEKQQEILDILSRFSPLMEYKINKESIDQERRRSIEQHHRGDIDLLSVMLNKYDIVSLRPS